MLITEEHLAVAEAICTSWSKIRPRDCEPIRCE